MTPKIQVGTILIEERLIAQVLGLESEPYKIRFNALWMFVAPIAPKIITFTSVAMKKKFRTRMRSCRGVNFVAILADTVVY